MSMIESLLKPRTTVPDVAGPAAPVPDVAGPAAPVASSHVPGSSGPRCRMRWEAPATASTVASVTAPAACPTRASSPHTRPSMPERREAPEPVSNGIARCVRLLLIGGLRCVVFEWRCAVVPPFCRVLGVTSVQLVTQEAPSDTTQARRCHHQLRCPLKPAAEGGADRYVGRFGDHAQRVQLERRHGARVAQGHHA